MTPCVTSSGMSAKERLELDPAHDGSCLVDLIARERSTRRFCATSFSKRFQSGRRSTSFAWQRRLAAAGSEPGFLAEATLSAAALPSFGRDAESRAALRAAVTRWDGPHGRLRACSVSIRHRCEGGATRRRRLVSSMRIRRQHREERCRSPGGRRQPNSVRPFPR